MAHPRILLVDDSPDALASLSAIMTRNSFDVVTAGSVKGALGKIAAEPFDVLLCDLHLPGSGDGFTVISAMRHTNPDTITIVFSGYPDLQRAMSAILLQADEIIIKPLDVTALLDLIEDRLSRAKFRVKTKFERVAAILERETYNTIEDWYGRVERCADLTKVPLNHEDRTGHLPMLFAVLVDRLRHPRVLEEQAPFSQPAHDHGCLRWQQGYTTAMMVEESRMLQVSIFQTLHRNLTSVDFSLLLTDVMAIADEVDSQLKQQMLSYTAAQERGECTVSI
ncbi:MAG: response regulator [Acidobacteriaceae bacterium]